MDKKFIYGKGMLDSNQCFDRSEESLNKYLGIFTYMKIVDIMKENDQPKFRDLWSKMKDEGVESGSFYAEMKNAEGEYRAFKLVLSKMEGDKTLLEITDVENAMEQVQSSTDTGAMLTFLLGRLGEVFFEYDHKNGTLDIYRYGHENNRISLINDKIYASIYEEMYRDISTIDAKNNLFRFRKIYTSGDNKYFADGREYVSDFAKRALVGKISPYNNDANIRSDYETHDELTGLYNKSYALALARETMKSNDKVSFIRIDIDDFKTVNKEKGQDYCNGVLRQLAVILREISMDRGFSARIESDDFLMVLQGIKSEQELRTILQCIYFEMGRVYSGPNRISMTMGIAEYPRNSEDFDILMQKVDKALYIGKFKGKNRYLIYNNDLHDNLKI